MVDHVDPADRRAEWKEIRRALENAAKVDDAEWEATEAIIERLNIQARCIGVLLIVAGIALLVAELFIYDGDFSWWNFALPSALISSGVGLMERVDEHRRTARRLLWFTAAMTVLLIPARLYGLPFGLAPDWLPGAGDAWLTPWLGLDIAIHVLLAFLCISGRRILDRPEMHWHFDGREKYVQDRERVRRRARKLREQTRGRIRRRRAERRG